MTKIIAFLAIILVASVASAGVVRIYWVYPMAEEANIDGYRIYYGKTSNAAVAEPPNPAVAGPYTSLVERADPKLREINLTIPAGTYYFRVTTFKGGVSSLFSIERKHVVPLLGVSAVGIENVVQ